MVKIVKFAILLVQLAQMDLMIARNVNQAFTFMKEDVGSNVPLGFIKTQLQMNVISVQLTVLIVLILLNVNSAKLEENHTKDHVMIIVLKVHMNKVSFALIVQAHVKNVTL